MPRAILSVHDKTGLIDFATRLAQLGYDLVASGGTERELRAAGLTITPVEQLTGISELLGGRVKTLHPAIHAGILARDRPEDLADLKTYGYAPIDLVVCNLYPFQQTIARPGVSLQDAVEQIDVGGVTLLRAAAKNFMHTTVLCDPADYTRVAEALQSDAGVDLALRRELAVKAFSVTRDYDTAIHAYLSGESVTTTSVSDGELPKNLSLALQQIEVLRYGENPHQIAAHYSRRMGAGPLGGVVLGGKALSYNNILDLDAAWRTVSSFSSPTVVIVKHLTPCGIASGMSIAEAFPAALESDPVSAFGGVIAVNQVVDEYFAAALGSLFVEAIAAPGFTDTAQHLLHDKRKNCRLLSIPVPYDGADLEIRSVHRGMLVQSVDRGDPEGTHYTTVTRRQPSAFEVNALRYAWLAVQHVRSNAIVIAVEQATLGIGGGLPSRLDAAKMALAKAGTRARGAVLASDAFFPFADGLQVAIEAGITAVIQPGGSIRDAEVIAAADAAGLAMIFTGIRHFRH